MIAMTAPDLLVTAIPTGFRGVLAVVTALVVASFLVLAGATLVLSGIRRLQDRRREEIRDRLRRELLERQREGNATEEWIDGLSRPEREELEAVVERYLQMLSGREREQYQPVAAALGMGERADRMLDRPSITPRLRAVALLTLVEYPVSRMRLLHTCLDTRRTREAAAKLVELRRGAFDEPEITGTTLLLFRRERALTQYGLETLYNLNDADPLPILIRASRDAGRWDTGLLVQVCTVLEHCRAVVQPRHFEWAFDLFDHEEPLVRASAIGVFRRHGWQRDLRSRLPLREFVTDDDPRVRRRTYEVLATWGDEDARQLLEQAVADEEDSRCQLVAVRALVSLGTEPDIESSGWPSEAWEWVDAELRADANQQLPTRRGPPEERATPVEEVTV